MRFSKELLKRAIRLAPMRHRPNKQKGFKDHNVPWGSRPPKEREDAYGLMAELQFAELVGVAISDEKITTYTGHSTDILPGVEVRGRSFPQDWRGDRDIPVWDKDRRKNPHTLVGYAITRETFEYERRWLSFNEAWDGRRRVRMGNAGRDMMAVSFSTMTLDDDALLSRLGRGRLARPRQKLKDWLCSKCQEHYPMPGSDLCVFCSGGRQGV